MDVVGIDYPVMDFLVYTPKLPQTNGVSRIKEYSWQGGGKVSSALTALGRLGVKTGIVGVTGNDPYGRFCRDDFKRHGVDTSHLIIDPDGRNCLCLCIAEEETQGRSFMGFPSGVRALEPEDLDKDYILSARYLHLCNMSAASRQAARWIRDKGGQVVFDADHHKPEIEENYHLVDVFIASEFYYHAVFHNDSIEANCRAIQMKGPRIVVFTFGEKGCSGVWEDQYFTIPAFEVAVMDTTGAGDVFHGAFIYGLLQDWTAVETAVFASAVAAIKCTRVGGRAGVPNLGVVKRFLKDGLIDYEEIDQRVNFYRDGIFRDQR